MSRLVTRTLLNIDGAACAHHDGDSDEACRCTVTALTALLADYRTGLVRRRALDLYEAGRLFSPALSLGRTRVQREPRMG